MELKGNMSIFDKAFELVLEIEGGYADHPNDHGGVTNYGITQKVLAEWRDHPVTKEDIKNMTKEEAKDIYKDKYWDPLKLDKVIHNTLKLILFDQAVNRGVISASKAIQRVVEVNVDGKIGPATVRAINKKSELSLCFDFIKDAQHFYINICKRSPDQVVFLSGWLNRTHKLIDIIKESILEN